MLAHNRKRPRRFIHAAGMRYAARLRAVAQQAGRITRDFSAEDPASAARIESRLRQYAESLHEWAANAAQATLQDIERLEAKQWKARMREMSRALRHEIRTAPTGEAMRALLDEQVTLIKSIPEEAARRVHEWALEGSQSGPRAACRLGRVSLAHRGRCGCTPVPPPDERRVCQMGCAARTGQVDRSCRLCAELPLHCRAGDSGIKPYRETMR